MPKPGSTDRPDWAQKIRQQFDEEEELAIEELRVIQLKLDEIRRRRALAFPDAVSTAAAPQLVDPEFIGKETGKQVALCLERVKHAMTLDEITNYLHSVGALSRRSAARRRDSVRKAVLHWSSTPEQRREQIKKREKKIGKRTKHDPQTLVLRGDIETGLIGLLGWPDENFSVG
jgi:hypothetical protein